jgi:hypothetical protein
MDANIRRTVVIRDYNFTELIAIYRTTYYLLKKKIAKYQEEIGHPDGYDANQVNRMFQLIPLPQNVDLITLPPKGNA